jgi:hypothetical protein
MAQDASEVLGAAEEAGSFVGPKGLTKRMTVGVAANMLGGIVGGTAAGVAMGKFEGAPEFGRIGYLAVTASEVAIVEGKSGAFKPKIGQSVIARAPRAEVASAELDGGMLKAALKIGFANGGWWEFEIPKINRKTAENVVRTLGGTIS